MIKTLPITAIVIAKNEEKNIAQCLKSLVNFDEVIVLNNQSNDNTAAIAKSFINTKVLETEWKGYGPTKQIGVNEAKNEWIFWIDADEQLSSELEKCLYAIFSQDNILEDGFSILRRTFVLGKWIKHCGWYPDRIKRIFKKSKAHFNTNVIHEGLIFEKDCKIKNLNGHITHNSYPNLATYFSKLLHYSQLASSQIKIESKAILILFLIIYPVLEFIKRYFIRLGFLDGVEGFTVCIGSSFYQFSKYAYSLEKLRTNKTRDHQFKT